MSISRITDLFAANIDSFSSSTSKRRITSGNNESPASDSNSEAVQNRIAQSSENQISKAQKIENLRAAINSKNYAPPKPKVAEALFRDLF